MGWWIIGGIGVAIVIFALGLWLGLYMMPKLVSAFIPEEWLETVRERKKKK